MLYELFFTEFSTVNEKALKEYCNKEFLSYPDSVYRLFKDKGLKDKFIYELDLSKEEIEDRCSIKINLGKILW